MPSINQTQLRLRVFAGPNGSGKSTVINYVQAIKVNGRSIDFGYYINADDIAVNLRSTSFAFNSYDSLPGRCPHLTVKRILKSSS